MHAASAYRTLRDQLQKWKFSLFLGTAHPAKLKQSIKAILSQKLSLPNALALHANLLLLSYSLLARFREWRYFLRSLLA